MLSAVHGFVSKHRRAFAVTAGVTGGIYLTGRYAKSKLIEFHEKTAAERTAKENMKRRFEQNQQDCVFTVLSLLPTLGDQLLHELNVELITAKLQKSKSQRSTPTPTPDNSMIFPPKSAKEGEAASIASSVDLTASTDAVFVNHEDANSDEHEGKKHDKQGADQEPTTEIHTTQESEDGSKVNGDSEARHSKESSSRGTDSFASEDEKDPTSEKTPVTNGSVPEIQIHQEVKKDGSPPLQQQQVEDAEETTASSPKVVVKDGAASAIDRQIKLELWNELKIMSFTRTITALYSLTLLTLLTQVQLNLLGRFTYVSSVVALANTTDAAYRIESPSTKGPLSFQTEKKYLTFSYWLLHEGWRRWSEKVRGVVEDIVGTISLKKTFAAKEFSDLLGEIRARLEYKEVEGKREPVNMREYMLPDDPAEEREVLRAGGVDEFDLVVDPVLRNLLDETHDFIDSADFATVLSSTLATTFARFNLALQPTFNPFLLSPPRNPDSAIEEIVNEDDMDRAVPLASLLPLVARQVHLIINGVPNEYVEGLSMVKELQAFSAIVYSSFSEDQIHS
ncbi:peroxin [Modicella reniformis]|uniref:Peroxin n=1 Tax=Modicella reniformis TaxID=1440133 RepID=A0A9P6MAQ7_9FUNG|nr:peroxin [Modicella reniformis]